MNREFKQLPCFKVQGDSGRVRTGIAAVMGNVDDGGDRLHPGAFVRSINNGGVRFKHLWAHDWSQPPLASIKELKEITRAELPQEVLDFAPDATGGLLVTREYFDTPLADWVLQALDTGDMEMSIGYAPTQTEYTESDVQEKIRELKEVKLLETSDVPFGMNPATVAAFAKSGVQLRPLGAVAGELQLIMHEMKSGRRNSTQDMGLIEKLHQNIVDLGFDKCIMKETDAKSATDQNATSDEPAPVLTDTALRANALRLNELRLSQLLRRSEYVCSGS